MALPLNEWLAIFPEKDSEHKSPRPMRLADSLFRETGESFPIEFIIGEDKPRARLVAAMLNVDFADNGRRTTPHFELKGSVVTLGKKKPERSLLFHAQAYDPYRRIGIIKLSVDPKAPKLADEISVEELEIGVRAYDGLKRMGLDTAGDVLRKGETSLLDVPNFGKKTIEEIKAALQEHGLLLTTDQAT